MSYPDYSATSPRIGQQLLAHFAQRDAVRHATPLLPASWRALFPLARASRQAAKPAVAVRAEDAGNWCGAN